MKILAIDTATDTASAAIIEDNKIAAEYTLNHKKTHSQRIMPMIDRLLQDTENEVSDIDVFAAVNGPGSFTGLRIGVATIKALAHAAGKPCCGISSLRALAYNVKDTDCYIVPIMDARRDNVYTAAFVSENGSLEQLWEDCAASIEQVAYDCGELEGRDILFLGDGIFRHEKLLRERLGERARFANANLSLPKALSAAQAAMELAKSGGLSDYLHLNPVYIRKPQAEREREERENVGIRQ